MAKLTFTKKRWFPGFLSILWFFLLVFTFQKLIRYSVTPGTSGELRPQWPRRSQLIAAPDRPTLVLFLHPKCTCSRASLHELDILQARSSLHAKVYVVFVEPKASTPAYGKTDLWKSAEKISGTELMADYGGTEAHRFGALTSGHVMIYEPQGKLVFTGGITGARGHEGDNFGLQEAIECAKGRCESLRQSRVFGCSLFDGSKGNPKS